MTTDEIIFSPGDRVEILDRGNNSYQPATVVSIWRYDVDRDQHGYWVRYDNGCEVWIRDYYVSAPRRPSTV